MRTVYDVTVWNNMNGDVVLVRCDISDDELDELRSFYEDEPFCEVVIDAEREEHEDDE